MSTHHLTDLAPHRLSRRAFLAQGSLLLATAPSLLGALEEGADTGDTDEVVLRIGLLTDVHYADKDAAGTRQYRDSIAKMREATGRFRDELCAFAVELGDFVDAADTEATEAEWLRTIDGEFGKFSGPRHYVLGNHCVYTLSKETFLETVGAKSSYYSFDQGDYHFVVLDACFRSDGVPYGKRNYQWTDTEIPPEERDWLRQDLEATDRRTIAFVHQRLDVAGNYGVQSGPAVRGILEDSGKVVAVFQGHYHENDHNEIRGIHYTTLRAVVDGPAPEKSGYAVLEILSNGLLRLRGFREQESRTLRRRRVQRV